MLHSSDHRLQLLKGIILLYKESHLPDNTSNSADSLRRIIKEAVAPDMVVGRSIEGEISNNLKTIASSMVENPSTHVYDAESLKMEVMMACSADEALKPIIEDAFKPFDDVDKLKLSVLNLRQSIKHHFMEVDLKNLLVKSSLKFSNDRDSIPSMKNYVSELIAKLEPYATTQEEKDPAINYAMYLNNLEQAEELVSRVQMQESGEHILQVGWQGMNRMLDKGFRPGEQWVIGAEEHNWKTGFSLSLFLQIALFNDGVCVNDPKKKPALVRMSFEDSAEANMQFMYKFLWENETGQILEEFPKDTQEVAKYVHDKLSARGWHIFIYDVNPSMWTYMDICNEIMRLEAKGFEVRVCMLDYLLKIPTTGCIQGPHGVDIRNLYERIKAFMAPRKITMITPHQLSPDAKLKVREGTNNFVKEMVGGGYYSGTKQLAQVIDGELFIKVESDPKGNFYLAIQRGKHRKIQQTPVEYRHIALKFQPNGIIPNDIDGPDTTRLKVGGPMLCDVQSDVSEDFGF